MKLRKIKAEVCLGTCNQSLQAYVMVLVAGVFGLAAVARAGDLLPPPGPVVPTMKTLSEVEPRIAINATNTPGDVDSLYKITSPGSYYLTGNVAGEVGKHGIEIAVGGVKVDLMGFELAGVPGSLDGMFASVFGIENIAITNGAVRDWGESGINMDFNLTRGAMVDRIRASNNDVSGIRVRGNSVVADCTATDNGDIGIGAGISTDFGCIVVRCTATNNANIGIYAATGSSIIHCAASSNGPIGISTLGNVLITGCHAWLNDGIGISAPFDAGARIHNCVSNDNIGDGIRVGGACTIENNLCNGNGVGDGAGIHVTGTGNRIEANSVTDSDRGIDVDSGSNLVIRNSARGNTVEYDIVAGNTVGPIVTAATIAASDNPHANYDY